MKQTLFIIVSVFFSKLLIAGFPIGRGKYLVAPSYNYYNAPSYWNNDGERTEYKNKGIFDTHYFGVYTGIGINEKLDFVGNINYLLRRRKEADTTMQNGNFGDASFGFQYNLDSYDYYRYLSITGSVIIPLYQNNPKIIPYTGYQQVGAELKLSLSGNNQSEYFNSAYYDINAGIRQFFSTEGSTQLFFDALIGIPFDKNNHLTMSFSTMKSNSNQTKFDYNNLSAIRTLSYFRLNAGYGRKIDQNNQLFLNIFNDINGKNTGKSGGVSVTLVTRL